MTEPDPAFVRCDDCAWDLCDQAKVCRKTTYERMKHRIECADTPLMRDVLAERDGLKEQLEALREAARPFAEPDDTTLTQYEVLRAVLYPATKPDGPKTRVGGPSSRSLDGND